jgi:hypothetical protein
MNRQAMAALRARLQAKIAEQKPLTTPETSQYLPEEKEPMSNDTAVLDEVFTEQHEEKTAMLAIVNDTLLTGPEEEELSEEEDDMEQVSTVNLAPVSPHPTKVRPRRKRHYVGRTADGKCELLYVDMRVPGVAEELHAKFQLIPCAFRTRTIAEWYIENAANLPGVKTARDAEKAFKAEKALIQG